MGRGRWAAVAALAAFAAFVGNAAAITNGKLDGDAHPNVGALYATAPGFGLQQFCSGTLVAPGVFLTAGHCIAIINSVPGAQMFVSFAPTFVPATLIPATGSTIDPAFGQVTDPNQPGDPHDIAVVTFDPQAPAAAGIRPVLLPPLGAVDVILKFLAHDRSGGFGRAGLRGPERIGTIAPAVAQARKSARDDAKSDDGKPRAKPGTAVFVDVGYGATVITQPGPDGIRRSAVSGDPLLVGDNWLVLSQDASKGFGGTGICDSGGPQFVGPLEVSITIDGDATCTQFGINLRLDTPAARSFLSSVGVPLS
jgi:Trypsin